MPLFTTFFRQIVFRLKDESASAITKLRHICPPDKASVTSQAESCVWANAGSSTALTSPHSQPTMVAASIARTRFKSEPRQLGFCEVDAEALDGYAAESASGGAEGKTEGKTVARNKCPQLPQVCARGGLDLPQFGQFIPAFPIPKLSLDHHARPG